MCLIPASLDSTAATTTMSTTTIQQLVAAAYEDAVISCQTSSSFLELLVLQRVVLCVAYSALVTPFISLYGCPGDESFKSARRVNALWKEAKEKGELAKERKR